eukprot:353021-Chlamydomonas_euryale.AAC.7
MGRGEPSWQAHPKVAPPATAVTPDAGQRLSTVPAANIWHYATVRNPDAHASLSTLVMQTDDLAAGDGAMCTLPYYFGGNIADEDICGCATAWLRPAQIV